MIAALVSSALLLLVIAGATRHILWRRECQHFFADTSEHRPVPPDDDMPIWNWPELPHFLKRRHITVTIRADISAWNRAIEAAATRIHVSYRIPPDGSWSEVSAYVGLILLVIFVLGAAIWH